MSTSTLDTEPVTSAPGSPAPSSDPNDLRRYLAGSATSTFGSVLSTVTVAVLAVTVFHVSGFQAGILAAAGTVPTVLVGLYAGALSDRARRPRRSLIAADLAAAAAVTLLAVAVLTHSAGFAGLVALELALGLLSCWVQAVSFTHLAAVVGADGIAPARGALQTASYTASAVGGSVAGVLVRALGPAAALLIDAASYLVSVLSLRTIRAADRNPAHEASRPAAAARPSIHAEIREGLAIVSRGPLRSAVTYAVVAQAAFAATTALKALFLLRTLDLPVYLYGVPGIAAAGAGTLGSLLCTRMVRRGLPPARLTVGWWTAGAFSLGILPAAHGPVGVALALAVVGTAAPILCGAAANVSVACLITEAVPPAAMGRVNSCLVVAVSAATMAGALVGGWAADAIGIRATIWCAAAVSVAALVLLVPLRTRAVADTAVVA